MKFQPDVQDVII